MRDTQRSGADSSSQLAVVADDVHLGCDPAEVLDLLDAIDDAGEHHGLPVEPAGLDRGKKLRAVGARADVRRGQDFRVRVPQTELFLYKLVASIRLAYGQTRSV